MPGRIPRTPLISKLPAPPPRGRGRAPVGGADRRRGPALRLPHTGVESRPAVWPPGVRRGVARGRRPAGTAPTGTARRDWNAAAGNGRCGGRLSVTGVGPRLERFARGRGVVREPLCPGGPSAPLQRPNRSSPCRSAHAPRRARRAERAAGARSPWGRTDPARGPRPRGGGATPRRSGRSRRRGAWREGGPRRRAGCGSPPR